MPASDQNPLPDFLFIYGPPGVGKSTVAHKLAQSLKLPCVEIDVEVERQAGCSIRELFDLSSAQQKKVAEMLRAYVKTLRDQKKARVAARTTRGARGATAQG